MALPLGLVAVAASPSIAKPTFCRIPLNAAARNVLTAVEAGQDVADAVRRKFAAGEFKKPKRSRRPEKSFLHAILEHCPEVTEVVCKELYALDPKTLTDAVVAYLKEMCFCRETNPAELLRVIHDIGTDVLQTVFEKALANDSPLPRWVFDSEGTVRYLSKYTHCMERVVARALPNDKNPLADLIVDGTRSKAFMEFCKCATPGVRKEMLKRCAFTAATLSTFQCKQFKELLGELSAEELDEYLVYHPLVTERDRHIVSVASEAGGHKKTLDFLRSCISEKAFRVLLGSRLVHGLIGGDATQFVDTIEEHFPSHWPDVVCGQHNFLSAMLQTERNFPRTDCLALRKLSALTPEMLERALMAGAESDVPIAFIQVIYRMECFAPDRYHDSSEGSVDTEDMDFMKKRKGELPGVGRLERMDLKELSKQDYLTWRELFELVVSLHRKTPGGVKSLLKSMHSHHFGLRAAANMAADIMAVAIENNAVDEFLFEGHSAELAVLLGARVFLLIEKVLSEAGLPGKAIVQKWMRRVTSDGRSVFHVAVSSKLLSWPDASSFLKFFAFFGKELVRELCLTPFVEKTLSLTDYAPPLFYLRTGDVKGWTEFLTRLNDSELIMQIYSQKDQWGRTQLLQWHHAQTWPTLKHLYKMVSVKNIDKLRQLITYKEPYCHHGILDMVEEQHFYAAYAMLEHVCGTDEAKGILLSDTKTLEMSEKEVAELLRLPQHSYVSSNWREVKQLRAVSGSILFSQPGYPGVVRCLKEVLTEKELRSLLVKTSPKGETFLHVLGKAVGGVYGGMTFHHYTVPQGLEMLPRDVLTALLVKPDPSDDAALFLHQAGGNTFAEFMSKQAPDCLQFSFLARSDKGETVVHRLVRIAKALHATGGDAAKFRARISIREAIALIEMAERVGVGKALEEAADLEGNVFTKKELSSKTFLDSTSDECENGC